MSAAHDLLRWARLWATLPGDERRARAQRVTDRLLRRRAWTRRLLPPVPAWRSFAAALVVSLDELDARLAAPLPARGPLWCELETRARAIAARFAAPLAPAIRAPEPARGNDGRIDWHRDGASGVRWSRETYFSEVETVRLDGSDVLVPWKLSRFQHILALGAAARLAAPPRAAELSKDASGQVLAWIADNPPGLGVNWASPMEVALRAVSWTAALGLFRGLPGWEAPVRREIARSLWLHGRHVRRNLEIPSGAPATNHYLADLLGLLCVARALPELRDARAWGELARNGLVEEIGRQVGADGVSFERSLPYHGFALEIFLYAAILERGAGRPLPRAYAQRLELMLEATAWSLRPDGTIPAWGDGDDGRVLPLSRCEASTTADQRRLLAIGGRLTGRLDLAALAEGDDADACWLLGPTTESAQPFAPWRDACGRRFGDSGWHVMRAGAVHVGVATGPVGTRGLGNHTHNDLFAPCVWAEGREWIVDPGTGSYARDLSLRQRLRGVASHAALQLGEREPNELPPGRDGLFRVIERAQPETLAWEATPARARLEARHRGYSGPEGAWIWWRRLTLDAATGILSAHDRLEAEAATEVAAAPRDAWLRLTLAPGLAARAGTPAPALSEVAAVASGPRLRPGVVVSDDAGRSLHVAFDLPEGSDLRIEAGVVSPRYGVLEQATVLVVRLPVAAVVEAGWALR